MKNNKIKVSNESPSNSTYSEKEITFSSSFSSSPTSSSFFPSPPSSSLLINILLNHTSTVDSKKDDFKAKKGIKYEISKSKSNTSLPLFLNPNNKIKIPSKVEHLLRRRIPRSILQSIDPDIEIAIDKCLLFISFFSSTYFKLQENSKFDGWKSLKVDYLQEYFTNSSQDYKKIITALKYNFKTGPIIECDEKKVLRKKNYHYRLGKAYIAKGLKNYELKTDTARYLLNKHFNSRYNLALKNIIANNVLNFYPHCTFPTIEVIDIAGKVHVKNKYRTKKGKRLLYRNKHANSYFKNSKELSFVEDSIKKYISLVENGLMIPRIGSAKSGGRVVDALNLMPSWIRNLIKIDGVPVEELDFSCLHPNIGISLYGGERKFITHAQIAEDLKVDIKIIKQEHLSFFNKRYDEMKESILFEYYMKAEPEMMKNLKNGKFNTIYEHKNTSRKLFAKEVEIMTEVIRRLNQVGIYVGYIYDALICNPKHTSYINEVMSQTALDFGVYTKAKLPERFDAKTATLHSGNVVASSI